MAIVEINCWAQGIIAGFNACGFDHQLEVSFRKEENQVELTYLPDNPCADDEQRMLELEEAFVATFIRLFGGRCVSKTIHYNLNETNAYSATIQM